MTQRTIEDYQQYWKDKLLSTGTVHPDTETLHSDSFEHAHEVVVSIEPKLPDGEVEVTFYSEEIDPNTGDYQFLIMGFDQAGIEEFIEKLRKVALVVQEHTKAANQTD